MKDNDLLVTELYHDPSNDAITALSVYLTPKTSEQTFYPSVAASEKSCLPLLILTNRQLGIISL